MAAGDSPTSIANIALTEIGEDPISSLIPPDSSRAAIVAAQHYDPSRRAMLEAHPWRCAKRMTTLAAAASAPPFKYGAAYPLPADFIRLYKLDMDLGMPWEIMNLAGIGPCILTNAGGPIDIEYIFDLQDCTQMTPTLVMAVAYDLAAALAIPIAHDASLVSALEAKREGRLSIARTIDA